MSSEDLDAWRARGDHRFDPVRFRFIEALAKRTAAHGGEARRILDDRVRALLAAYRADLDRAPRAESPQAPRKAGARQDVQAPRSALAELVEHIGRHAPVPAGAATPELKSLKYFQSTWSTLSADRRLTQSLAKVPENAGPLNSHHLVHRSLTLMRALSPEYLNRFMSYVDALLWIDQANAASSAAGTATPRAEGNRKTARGKSG